MLTSEIIMKRVKNIVGFFFRALAPLRASPHSIYQGSRRRASKGVARCAPSSSPRAKKNKEEKKGKRGRSGGEEGR